jgi:Domain of unknown function (DUF4259)
MYDAIERDDPAALQRLLAEGAQPPYHGENWSPLHHAVDAESDFRNQADTPPDLRRIGPLIATGADVNALSRMGRGEPYTPLDLAITCINHAAIEAAEGVCALAAADVVARLVSGRGEDSAYCEDVVAWVAANAATPSPSLVAKAKLVVELVRGADSELAELWSDDAETLADWLATLTDVRQRLDA